MSVEWLDSPGSVLPSAGASIRFRTDRDCTALSVAFSGRAEERIYRDGAFLYPYLESTVEEGEDELTFELFRSGGWPSDPRVYVDEEPAPPEIPAGGMPWGAIYTLDFAAQPTQSLAAAGAHTIDGLTWWAKNGALTAGATIEIVNGEGLNWWASSNNYPSGRIMGLSLTRIPGFNNLAPYQVWFNLIRLGGSADSVACGLIDSPDDATPHTTANAPDAFMYSPVWTVSNNYWYSFLPWGNNGFAAANHAADGSTGMFGMYAISRTVNGGLIETGYAGGALPPSAPWLYGGLYNVAGHPVRANAMIAMSGVYNAHVRIRKMTVLQPKVTA